MARPAIRVHGLWKAYEIGAAHASRTMYDVLTHALSLGRKAAKTPSPVPPPVPGTFWALKDVQFEVPHGQVVGIIGRNGAGKSTLLKVLSRITPPTRGRVEVQGRLASLLEVGTGFHPELSGRENIFVNGAILGMTRAEVNRKFEEITEFAEIGDFLDTPVKRYSSGMYVRLAFAVAAHLEPDILIVDEVLAVGDAHFQKKCLAKIENVAGHGRTVLFVSHNMAAIQALCPTAILMEGGRVDSYGPTAQAVARYAASGQGPANQSWEPGPRQPDAALALSRIECALGGRQPDLRLSVAIQLTSRRAHKPAFVAIDILDSLGVAIMQALPRNEGFVRHEVGRHDLLVEIELTGLVPGTYFLTVWTGSHNTETLDCAASAVSFDITDSPCTGRTFPHSPDHGHIVPASTVRIRTTPS
jgi:lipopolysaccharide transport system ATP-binding protein